MKLKEDFYDDILTLLQCCCLIGEVYKTKRGRTFCGPADGSIFPGLTIKCRVFHHRISKTNLNKYNSGGKVGGTDKAADEEGFREAVAVDDVKAVCQDAVRE